jgi:hypothetical protein
MKYTFTKMLLVNQPKLNKNFFLKLIYLLP